MKKAVCNLFSLLVLSVTSVLAQQSDWHPVSVWPFVYEQFQNAVIYTGPANKIVKAKSNIHVANGTLWYESNGKKLEAKSENVNKVVFPDSVAYYTVSNMLCSVLSEDSINGKLCRLYVAELLDKSQFQEMTRINNQSMMTILDLSPALTDIANDVANNEGMRNMDREPLPMRNKFFMLYDGETFEATESNILKRLATKQERNAYRGFTRSAEILYGSKSSMLTVWKTFFVK